MIVRRNGLRSLFAGAVVAAQFLGFSVGSPVDGQSETNRHPVSFLALDRTKPPEALNLPDDARANIEQVWLLSAKNGDRQVLNEIVTELVSPKDSVAFTAPGEVSPVRK